MPVDSPNNRKIMIVMTDGNNDYETNQNFNRSGYGAFGYVAKGHLGTTSSDRNTVLAKLNEKTLEACANAKAEGGVQIYTVAFRVSDPATLDLLRTCADTPEMAFETDSNGAVDHRLSRYRGRCRDAASRAIGPIPRPKTAG